MFALSGFTALALEVVWFRVNVLVLRPTVYTFAMMLATVLAGIALGSAAIAPFMKRRRAWLTILAAGELLIALAVLMSFQALETAPTVVAFAGKYLTFLPGYLVPLIVTSVVTIFPAMLLMGAAFPVGLHLWSAGARDTATVVRRVGTFSALNVTGAIAGSIAAGFVLLPLLGSRTTLIALSATTAFGAVLLLAVDRHPRFVAWRSPPRQRSGCCSFAFPTRSTSFSPSACPITRCCGNRKACRPRSASTSSDRGA